MLHVDTLDLLSLTHTKYCMLYLARMNEFQSEHPIRTEFLIFRSRNFCCLLTSHIWICAELVPTAR